MDFNELIITLNQLYAANATGSLSDNDLKPKLRELRKANPGLATGDFNKLASEIQADHPCRRLEIFLQQASDADHEEAERLEEDAQIRLRAKKLKQNGGKRLDTEFSRKEKLNKKP